MKITSCLILILSFSFNNAFQQIPYSIALKRLKENKIKEAAWQNDGRRIFLVDEENGVVESNTPPFSDEIEDAITKNQVMTQVLKDGPSVGQIIGNSLNIGIFGLVAFSLWRANRMANNAGLGEGNILNAPKAYDFAKSNITFDNVAGIDTAVRDLQDITWFLRDSSDFTRLGAQVPKGILLEGPPGTGKTLLASAVAGEANASFLAVNGAEFVQVYVGLGASRVRDLFEEARKNAPCIIFIDEIDALGKTRSSTGMNGNDEREQTLNQLLAEIDGFNSKDDNSVDNMIVLMGATNRIDTLDPALTRSGRFDRKIYVGLPDIDGRVEILQKQSENKVMNKKIDWRNIAKRTQGYSGADIANVLNEATLIATKTNKTSVTSSDINDAIEYITTGKPLIDKKVKDKDKLTIAVHELGHAFQAACETDYDEIDKVTIIGTTNGAAGFTSFVPNESQQLPKLEYMLKNIRVMMGGKMAEIIVFGIDNVTTGAVSDLNRAEKVAYTLVVNYGYKPKTFRKLLGSPNSEYGKKMIDICVQEILDEQMNKVFENLSKYKELLVSTSDDLIKSKNLAGSDIYDLFK